MSESPLPEYEHEHTVFTEQEFGERFSNFHLVFRHFDDLQYKSEINKFLRKHMPELSSQIVEKMKRVSRPDDIDPELMTALYNVYLRLKQEGGFSNKELGLIYW